MITISTGDIIATIIALLSALVLVGLAFKENKELRSENAWLRQRNKRLKKQLSESAPLPWNAAKEV